MSDLHTRLLAELDTYRDVNGRSTRPEAALRAVVERHAPEQHYMIGQDNRRRPSYLWCPRCKTTAPCEELRLIADQLGLTEGDRT